MADGTYERRGPRESELARYRRILAELAARKVAAAPSSNAEEVEQNFKG